MNFDRSGSERGAHAISSRNTNQPTVTELAISDLASAHLVRAKSPVSNNSATNKVAQAAAVESVMPAAAEPTMTFEQFSFDPKISKAVRGMGYTVPTPIQAQAIPVVSEGRDVMGLAQTGTGKTAAFALPILQRLLTGERGGVRALIIAPTRELVDQIHGAIQELGRNTGLRSATIYGGVSMHPQVSKIRAGVDIIVGCPGRILDHLQQRTLSFAKLQVLVLDEADQMFDMGFFPSIRKILNTLPAQRQNLLFSATMPDEIKGLARDIMRDPHMIQVGSTKPVETVSHAIYPVSQDQKPDLFFGLLKTIEVDSVLVFTRTKHRAKRLAERLSKSGYKTTSLHGNLSQSKRQQAMEGFRKGRFDILVATDIAARGIDISSITHVINFDIPNTVEAYTHRIGRTGRAEKTGEALTLVTSEDISIVRSIEKTLGYKLSQKSLEGFPVLTFDTSRSSGYSGRPQQYRSGGGNNRNFSSQRRPRRSGQSGNGGSNGRSFNGGHQGSSNGRRPERRDRPQSGPRY